jgi:ATP-binding cassette subfamily B (MDR/TAP) protein 1
MMRVADRVVMVEGGVVVESGGYEELVGRGGRFRALVGGGVWTGTGADTGIWGSGEGRRKRKGEKRVAREEALRKLEGEGF